MNTTIFVMGYGDFKKEKLPPCYQYILCGANDYLYSLSDILDNTFDNISSLNKYYSELTGLYWCWKNDHSDIKGLVCYRRFLIKKTPYPHFLSEKEILKTLRKYDIIMSKKKRFKKETVRSQFEKGVSGENIKICEEIIKRDYPDYLEDMIEIWKETSLSAYNIMICRSEIFDAYCEWLFSILFKMQSIVKLESLNGYQIRIFAFVSERLLPVWVRHNKLKIKYFDRYNTQWKKFLKLKLLGKTEK